MRTRSRRVSEQRKLAQTAASLPGGDRPTHTATESEARKTQNRVVQNKKRRYGESKQESLPSTVTTSPPFDGRGHATKNVSQSRFPLQPPKAHGPSPPTSTSSRRKDVERPQPETKAENAINVESTSCTQLSDAPEVEGVSRMDIHAYLPEALCQRYRSQGKDGKLFEWQAECLGCPGVLDGKNIVYCAPTSAGKSLVSEILLLRKLVSIGKPAMLVLPFVALCCEKASHLEFLLKPTDRAVRRFYGSQNSPTIFRHDTGILVCTIEKANTLVNRMIEEGILNDLGIVVVDELHMVDDPHRGYLLELLLTKLRYMNQKRDISKSESLQIVGMSATMPNGTVVAQWLGAELYVTQARPVPLRQFLKVGKSIRDVYGKEVRTLSPPLDWVDDPDHVAWLTKETVDNGHSVLIFCCSKKACEACAQHISNLISVPARLSKRSRRRESFLAELEQIIGEHQSLLSQLIKNGIAFHHAGLSAEERKLIEAAYKNGAVSVLTATSTLAAGVNLPARRVIFREPYVGLTTNVLDPTGYRQMAGRAGRAGIDDEGEAYLLESKFVKTEILQALIQCDAQPVSSCLGPEQNGMVRLLLEVITNKVVKTGKDIERLIGSTLLAQIPESLKSVDQSANAALSWLRENNLITWNPASEKVPGMWSATALSQAIVHSGMDPRECALVRRDLFEATHHLVLSSDLQLTYLVTPPTIEIPIDWEKLYYMANRLNTTDASIADLVGVSMVFLQKRNNGNACSHNTEEERVARRFYAALILRDIINEIPLAEICQKFKVSVGVIESLQEKAMRYANMSASFCESLGWIYLQVVIEAFQKRIYGGARPEIVHLTEIPFVKAYRARLLYKAGFKSVEAIAELRSLDRLARVIAADHRSVDNNQKGLDLHIAKKIVRGARNLLKQKLISVEEETKAAVEIVREESAELLTPSDAVELLPDPDIGDEADSPIDPLPETEISSTLRRLSFDPTPFLNAQGIVVLQTQAEVRELSRYLHSTPVDYISFQSDLEDLSSTAITMTRGIAICWADEMVVYIPLADDGDEKLKIVTEIIEATDTVKVTFRFIESMDCLYSVLQRSDSSVFGTIVDVHRAAKQLKPNAVETNDLAGLFLLFGKEDAFQEVKEYYITSVQNTCTGFRVLPCCSSAALTRRIWKVIKSDLEKSKLLDFFFAIDMPHMLISESLNHRGIPLSKQRTLELISRIRTYIQQLSIQIRFFSGDTPFDPFSNQQTAELLTKHVKLSQDVSDTQNEESLWLRRLQDQHPLPAAILMLRYLTRILESLTMLITDQAPDQHDEESVWLAGDLFHLVFQQWTDDEQEWIKNLPLFTVDFKENHIQMSPFDASNDIGLSSLDICRCLEPENGSDVVHVAYQFLDLWILAFFSQDVDLISALGHSEGNPARFITCAMLDTPISEAENIQTSAVSYMERFLFGFLFGAAPPLSARLLGVGEKRATELYTAFTERFSGVKQWLSRVLSGCSKTSEIRSIYGQRIPIDEEAMTEQSMLRIVIQASVKDIVKYATVLIRQKLSLEQSALIVQCDCGFVIEASRPQKVLNLEPVFEAMREAASFGLPTDVPIHSKKLP